MEVVLRQDVEKVGLRGEVVNVARGYARNYLLPRGLAEVATPALQREVAKRDAQRARHEASNIDEARSIADRLSATVLRFDVTAGPTGSLFGSVSATNVADRLWAEQKIRVDRRKLDMETIKKVGRYTVAIEVFGDVTGELKLVVAPPGVEPPSDEEVAAAAAAEAPPAPEPPEPPAEPEAVVTAPEAPAAAAQDEIPEPPPAAPLDEADPAVEPEP